MDDELAFDLDIVEIERAILNESEEGRALAAASSSRCSATSSASRFGRGCATIAAAGGEPQLLVNGLAELMRRVADSIEFPIGTPR